MKALFFILCLYPTVLIQANTMNLQGTNNYSQRERCLEDKNKWENKTDRSLSQHFSLKIEWNLLLLSTDKQMDDFSIQIKDAQGNIMYTEAHLSLPAEEIYPIEISNWANGVYTVTLCQDGKYAVCQFTK